MAKRRFRAHRRRVAPVLIGTTIAVVALGVSPALADTGAVYFDAKDNTAAGNPAHLFNATFTGISNVGVAETVMPNLTTALGNTAIGFNTLLHATSGSSNFAAGSQALQFDTTGFSNVAVGSAALFDNTVGTHNVAVGGAALEFTTGNDNIALGDHAGDNLTSGSDNVDIANEGKAGESRTIRIGTEGTQKKAFLAGVSGKTVKGTAQPVLVNGQGQLGTAAAVSAKATVSARKFSRLRAQVRTLRHEVSQLRARGH
jgi:hypothetical protein